MPDVEVAIHFSRSGDRVLAQPTEHLTHGETEGFSQGGNGDAIARFFKQCYGAIGTGSQKPGLLVTFALPGNADPEALPPFSQARQSKSEMGFLSPRAWEPVIEND